MVVNKWASWCGPCRFEFPFFQAVGGRARRRDRLPRRRTPTTRPTRPRPSSSELPLPYPSISDPDEEIGELFEGSLLPGDRLLRRRGRARLHPQGPYESERGPRPPRSTSLALRPSADNPAHGASRARCWLWLVLAAALALSLRRRPAPRTRRRCPRSSSAGRSTRRPRSGSARRSTTPPTTTRRWRSSGSTRPGGLDSSMREIVQDIIDAPMPVVVYVSPDGARAASAGAFITEAADVAAMAPQTNIGSASAVDVDRRATSAARSGVKIENDAAAFIRALAEAHGRDGALAERMVTEADNVTAEEALDASVIDLVAADEDELLAAARRLPGRGPEGADARHRPGWRSTSATCRSSTSSCSCSSTRRSPTCCCSSGLVGIAIEIFSPGLIIPGTLGRGLVPARRLRHRPAAGDRGRDRAAGDRDRADHRRGPSRRRTGSSASSGWSRSPPSGLLLFDTGSRASSRSRCRW